MDTLLVFDVDGTLTGTRQRMHEDFSRVFQSVCRDYAVFLVSGSDMPKIEEQLPSEVINLVTGIFTCSGNEMWAGGEQIYNREHRFGNELLEFLTGFVDNSDYPLRTGNHIETRTGTLNVSVVGRNADPKQRIDYFAHDNQHGERKQLIEALMQRFRDYEANVGGQISIDVTPRGCNKSQVFDELTARYPGRRMAFFGDNMHLGGNDRPLGDAITQGGLENKVFVVEDYFDTWKILREKYNRCRNSPTQVA